MHIFTRFLSDVTVKMMKKNEQNKQQSVTRFNLNVNVQFLITTNSNYD